MDTSVWNFYFADDAPEKQAITLEFFNQIRDGHYRIFVSEIVFREIDKSSDEKKSLLLNLVAEYQPQKLEITEEILTLAEQYISEGGIACQSC